MDNRHIIYALIDPRDNAIRYVGKSDRGLIRTTEHGTDGHLSRDKTYKGNWIRQLKKAGIEYRVMILEEHDSSCFLAKAEIWWIEFLRMAGYRLTNLTNGGDGVLGLKHSAKTRQKLSELTKKQFSDPSARAKAAEKAREQYGRPGVREKCSSSAKRRWGTEEAHVLCSSAALECQNRPEVRAARSARCKEKLKDPAVRAAFKARMTEAVRQPEVRKRMSKSHGGRPFRDENGTVYWTQSDAALALGISQSLIGMILKGQRKSGKHTLTYI